MIHHFAFPFIIAVSLIGCQQGDETWWQEHEERQSDDLAVSYAINEPNGGNYAHAVEIVRKSNRSAPEKKYHVGRLIVGSFVHPGSRRPAESLQQGLEMMEQAAVEPSPMELYVPQQLRMIFERGVGTPPDGVPIDREVAACWHKLENGGKGDPARCVALRRKRLPQLST
jgi:hypothetical protein